MSGGGDATITDDVVVVLLVREGWRGECMGGGSVWVVVIARR